MNWHGTVVEETILKFSQYRILPPVSRHQKVLPSLCFLVLGSAEGEIAESSPPFYLRRILLRESNMLGIRLDEGADLKSVGRNCLVGSSPTPSAYVPVATSARRLLYWESSEIRVCRRSDWQY